MRIRPGQRVALVGPNGAGKSTLIKLLCRFYDPDDGAIYVDGVPINQVALSDLRERIAVLFQSPVQYNERAAENIRFGNVHNSQSDLAHDLDFAARASGADEVIRRLPHGYDTQLGRWFAEGTELSIGEWQRVALARASFRPAQILILDEPTSAMDPWAEVEWAERFRRFAEGRISIIITHRLTTAMFADVIHVVAEGQVVESGSHEQLLSRDGLYARGWEAQARS
jgi:ATP-binding cassette, subfamily B, bacterial